MKVEVLNKSHIRSSFECEESSLSHYLQKQASQDMKKKLAVCFVAVNDVNEVLGYYTLSSESLSHEQIPERFRKKLPKGYRVPVTLLGRLARNLNQKGKGIGEYLLMDALSRSVRISKGQIGSMAVVTDPINQKAKDYYLKYGFIELPDSGRMFIPMKTLEQLF